MSNRPEFEQQSHETDWERSWDKHKADVGMIAFHIAAFIVIMTVILGMGYGVYVDQEALNKARVIKAETEHIEAETKLLEAKARSQQ